MAPSLTVTARVLVALREPVFDGVKGYGLEDAGPVPPGAPAGGVGEGAAGARRLAARPRNTVGECLRV